MTPEERWQKITDLFDLAIEMNPAEWDTFLDRECQEDPSMKEEVLRLLRRDRQASDQGFLRPPNPTELPPAPPAGQAGRGLHILCPHCRGAIEILDIHTVRDVTCPSCGSTFRVDQGATPTWHSGRGPRRLGRFEILAEVGVGTFGTVYKARDPQLERVVALKVPRLGNLGGEDDSQRFLREARSVAQLRHPSIVPVYEAGEADGLPYIASDFVEGITLADRLTAGRPNFRESAALVAAVAEALHHAHEHGVVHRDVKPSNIMIDPFGRPQVMDFGLAKRDIGEITITLDGRPLGTPAYMSPEQARGDAHQVDGRSDVYSLGAILYQLLTGELPFRGNSRMLIHQVLNDEPRPPRSLNDRIPRDLNTICLRCLQKEKHKRYATANNLRDDLERFLDGRPIAARPVHPIEHAWRWCKRNPGLAKMAATLLVVVCVSSGLVALQGVEMLTQRKELEKESRLRKGYRALLGKYVGSYNLPRPQLQAVDPLSRDIRRALELELENLDRIAGELPEPGFAEILELIRQSQNEVARGENARAEVSARAAIEKAEAFLKHSPHLLEGRRILTQALHWSLVVESDHDRSTAAHRRATEMLGTLIRDEPDKATGYRQSQCMNNYNYAKRLLRAGRRPEAMALFRESRDLGEGLLHDGRDDSLTLRTLGRIDSFLGEMENEDRQAQSAETSYCRSNELFRTVFEREPHDLDAILEYAISCEQVQNFYGTYDRVDDSTRYAKQICRVLRESMKDARDQDRIVVVKRLAQAYYMLEMQHARNQQVYAKDPKQFEEEVAGLEATSRKVHEIVEALRTLEATDEFLNYLDCMSCMNIYYVLVEYHKKVEAAREWLVRAHSRLPADLSKEPEDRRRFYESIRETYEEKFKKPN